MRVWRKGVASTPKGTELGRESPTLLLGRCEHVVVSMMESSDSGVWDRVQMCLSSPVLV